MQHLLPYLHPGARVLDVGSGSGYLSAVLHHLLAGEGQAGKVVGIDHISELAEWSVQNLEKDGLGDALKSKEIEIVAGDGRLGGFLGSDRGYLLTIGLSRLSVWRFVPSERRLVTHQCCCSPV